jgi:hypothetical protein
VPSEALRLDAGERDGEEGERQGEPDAGGEELLGVEADPELGRDVQDPEDDDSDQRRLEHDDERLETVAAHQAASHFSLPGKRGREQARGPLTLLA